MKLTKTTPLFERPPFAGLLIASVLAAFAFALMEWLFWVTKPSFMDALTVYKRVEVLFFSSALIAAILLLGLILAWMLSHWRWIQIDALLPALFSLATFLPAGVLASLLLLWIDNFTYTVFQFGIVTAEGAFRAVYALLFLFFIAVGFYVVRWSARKFDRFMSSPRRRRAFTALTIAAVFFCLFFPVVRAGVEETKAVASSNQAGTLLPHIFLITSDGVNATNLSVYGYFRETTPRIEALAPASLIAENAFPNSGKTAGSVISMYTSKYPTDTGVLYPPNILRGSDSYQHLPGILRSMGYQTIQISYPHFVDAYTLNLLNGFDIANDRSLNSIYYNALSEILPNDPAYFLYESGNRVLDRLRHIFFLKKMVNPYDLVVAPPDIYSDLEKLNKLLQHIRQSQQPLFVHLHFMGTHGAHQSPHSQVFSQGKTIQEEWNVDLYDDSIVDFDQHVGQLVDELTAQGILDNSILFIGSDHGQKYVAHNRIPFILRFPHGEHAGRIHANVQYLDLAPTILDYLNVEVPLWMQGRSLLQPELAQEPIFAFSTDKIENGQIDMEQSKPPYYQFERMSVVYCQQWFDLNLDTYEMEAGEVSGYRAPCDPAEGIDQDQAVTWMKELLEARGFEVEDLSEAFGLQSLVEE